MPLAAALAQPRSTGPEVYRPRRPAATLLHRAVRENLGTFVAGAGQREDSSSHVPPYVHTAFEAYLRCGILAHGFARVYCAGCMAYFDVPLFIFEDRFYTTNDENCNAPITRFGDSIASRLRGKGIVSLLGIGETAWENMLTSCNQHLSDTRCVYGAFEEISGAYINYVTYDIGQLSPYIDMNILGPGDGYDLHDWSGIGNWIMALSGEDLDGEWGKVFAATCLYYGELVLGDPPVASSSGIESRKYVQYSSQTELCLSVMVHSFVCWQIWEDGASVWNGIEGSGLPTWSFDIDETPTFVFQIEDGLNPYLWLPVENSDTSRGGLKAMYR